MQCYDIHCVPFGTITAPGIYFIWQNQFFPDILAKKKKVFSSPGNYTPLVDVKSVTATLGVGQKE